MHHRAVLITIEVRQLCFYVTRGLGSDSQESAKEQPSGTTGYNAADSSTVVLPCPDGATNVRYCEATEHNHNCLRCQ
jgi:hypothetical protein